MLYAIAVLVVVSVTPCLCTNNTTASNATMADNTTTLYIGALFNLDVNPDWGILPMAQQAVQEVNNNTHILPGYKLQLVLNSTGGNLGFAQHVFQEYLNSGPKKIMLLGPADDTMAKSIASYAALPQVRLMQFSYGTSDLDLANRRDLYPYFFRTAPSRASYDDPRIAMLKYYNWKEVGIVYGDSLLYMKLSNQFKERLKTNGITVLAEVRLQSNDPTRAVRTIKDREVHVIFGMFNHDVTARKLLCAAYKSDMHGPHYVWILLDSYNDGWWRPHSKDRLECDKIEMNCQIQNHFSFLGAGIRAPKVKIIKHAQKNVSTIMKDYYARVDSNNSTANRSGHALNVYDAVWSIAMVLDKSRGKLQSLNKSLESLTYGDAEAVEVFYDETLKLNFPSHNMKNVKYFSNGNRKFDVRVNQLYLADGRIRATSAGDVHSSKFIPSKKIHWIAGVPYRETEEQYIYRTIDANMFLTLVIIASLGLLYALICYISVTVYMKRKTVLLNPSGFVSLLIILGCMLNYITVILYGFDYSRVAPETVTRLCKVRPWTFSLGFSLSVGGLVAKLWIAYTVLSKRALMTKRKRLLWMLFLVLILLVVDVAFLTWWEMTDPLNRELKIVKSQPQYKCFEPITADTFKATNTVVETCSCTDLALWLSILLVFKSIVLLFGAFLARQTRKIYIPSLDDSRRCGACVFVACMFCVAGIIVAFTSELYPTLFYGFIGACIIFVTTFILAVLFNYQVIHLFCKPKHGHVTCQCCVPCCNKLSLTCAKSFQCCPCCVTCWSWIGRCIWCQSLCSGPQALTDSAQHSKLDCVIIGQPIGMDGRIMYLQNTIKERDEELEKLRQKRHVVSAATQTSASAVDASSNNNYDSNENINQTGVVKSTAAPIKNNMNNQNVRKAARKVAIFNQKLDFSHVNSKVDSNVQTHQASSRHSISRTSGEHHLYGRRGSAAVKPLSADLYMEEVTRLKTLVLEKEAEIQKLNKDIMGSPGTKIGLQGKAHDGAEIKPVVKILVTDENIDSRPSMERKKPHGNDSKKTSVSSPINHDTSKTARPHDKTSPSPPVKDEVFLKGMGSKHPTTLKSSLDSSEQAGEREGRKISVITPASVWLLGGIRDRVVLSEEETKMVADENQQVDASFLKKVDPRREGKVKESKEEKYERGTQEEVTAKELEKATQNVENQHNTDAVQMANNEGEATEHNPRLLEPARSDAAKQSTQDLQGNDVLAERDTENNGTRSCVTTPANGTEALHLVAAQPVENKRFGSEEHHRERKIKTEPIEDNMSSTLSKTKEKKVREETNGKLNVFDDKNNKRSNIVNSLGNNHGIKIQDRNDNEHDASEDEDSGEYSFGEDVFLHGVGEDEGSKTSESAGKFSAGSGSSEDTSDEDGDGKQNKSVARVRGHPMRRRGKRSWTVASKFHMNGQRSRDVKSLHVNSHSHDLNKETIDTSRPSTDENGATGRVLLKRRRAAQRKAAMLTPDYMAKSQSRLRRGSDVWKREPDFPVKLQQKGKQSYHTQAFY